MLTLNPLKPATPFIAVTVAVPASVPPPGFAPSATVTLPLNAVATFPCASSAVTCTAGAITAPAVASPGWTVKASAIAGPGVMLNPALATGVSALAAAVRV